MKKILPGDTFGNLIVLEQVKYGKNSSYLCKCVCGIIKEMWGSGLCNTKERTNSCGCLQVLSAQRPPGQAARTMLYRRSQANAKIKKLIFELSRAEHAYITSLNCFYCNADPSPFNPYLTRDGRLQTKRTKINTDRAWIRVNGIDRIDNQIGYIKTNCVPCCIPCNYSKLDYTVEEFVKHAYAIVEHQNTKLSWDR